MCSEIICYSMCGHLSKLSLVYARACVLSFLPLFRDCSYNQYLPCYFCVCSVLPEDRSCLVPSAILFRSNQCLYNSTTDNVFFLFSFAFHQSLPNVFQIGSVFSASFISSVYLLIIPNIFWNIYLSCLLLSPQNLPSLYLC